MTTRNRHRVRFTDPVPEPDDITGEPYSRIPREQLAAEYAETAKRATANAAQLTAETVTGLIHNALLRVSEPVPEPRQEGRHCA